jgi:hypothetical protein
MRGQDASDVYLSNDYTIFRVDGFRGYVDFVMDGRGRRLLNDGRTTTIPAPVLAAIRATYRPDTAPTTPARPILSRPVDATLKVGGYLDLKSPHAGEMIVVCTCGVYSECIIHSQITC